MQERVCLIVSKDEKFTGKKGNGLVRAPYGVLHRSQPRPAKTGFFVPLRALSSYLIRWGISYLSLTQVLLLTLQMLPTSPYQP